MPLKSNKRRREKEHEVRESSFNNRYNNITKNMTRTKGIYLFEVCRIHPTIDSFGVPSVKPFPPLHGIFGGKFEYKLHWVAGLAVENDVNEEAFAKHWTASIGWNYKRPWGNQVIKRLLHYNLSSPNSSKTSSQGRFYARIVKLDETYKLEPVLNLALQFHGQKAIAGIDDRDSSPLLASISYKHLDHASNPQRFHRQLVFYNCISLLNSTSCNVDDWWSFLMKDLGPFLG